MGPDDGRTARRRIVRCAAHRALDAATVAPHRSRRSNRAARRGIATRPTARPAVRARAPRDQLVLDGPVDTQVARAVELLRARGALDDSANPTDAAPQVIPRGAVVAVVTEPSRADDTSDLLGAAARLGADVVAIGPTEDSTLLGRAGANRIVRLEGSTMAEDVAAAVVGWAADAMPAALLLTSTDWGREVAARAAVALEATLVPGATGITAGTDHLLDVDTLLLAGPLVATTPVDTRPVVITVRPGSLRPVARPAASTVASSVRTVAACSRVHVRSRTRDPGLVALDRARAVVGVGLGVAPADYARLTPLLERLDGALACTRPVADREWLAPAQQQELRQPRNHTTTYCCFGSFRLQL